MRGAHPALAGSLTETQSFNLHEGAFYGDLFDPAGPQMYACDTKLADLDLELSTYQLRACALSTDGVTTECGMTYTGKCMLRSLDATSACSTKSVPFEDCRVGIDADAPRWVEVITVSLSSSLANTGSDTSTTRKVSASK